MMDRLPKYENYPGWMVAVSSLNQLLLYGMGLFIISRLGLIFALLYLAYILAMELRLVKNHCTDCYYWGKSCGLGRGKVSSLLFKQGDPSRFCNMGLTWKDLIPEMLVSLVPVIAGVILMIVHFNPLLLVAVAIILVLMTAGNALVRRNIACKYCKQRELGCPAEKLFDKANNK
jgi:hypothetical protein